MFSKTRRQENNCAQIGYVAFNYDIATTCMVSRYHLFNVFAEVSDLSTANNFAKAKASVCVDQSVGKKFDVVATDDAMLFYQPLPEESVLWRTTVLNFDQNFKISYC